MAFSFNPGAADFTPSSASPNTPYSGGQQALNAGTSIVMPNISQAGASSFRGDNNSGKTSSQSARPQGRWCRTRDRNRHKSNSTNAYDREVTQHMTPFYQWQTGPYGPYAESFQTPQGFAYLEYDNVSYYKNGKYGKAKKKSKKRDMTKVYGYKGSDKSGSGGFSHIDAARSQEYQQFQNHGTQPEYQTINGDIIAHGPLLGPSCNTGTPMNEYQQVSPATTNEHTRNGAGSHGTDSQNQVPRAIPSSTSSLAAAGTPSSAPIDAPFTAIGPFGNVSIDEQMAQVDRMIAQHDQMMIPTNHAIAKANPTANKVATQTHNSFRPQHRSRVRHTSPLRTSAVGQQSGSVAAEHDFLKRTINSHNGGSLTSLSAVVVNMYEEIKQTFFPHNVEAFQWPKKTAQQMGYIDRAYELSQMTEEELGALYAKIASGN